MRIPFSQSISLTKAVSFPQNIDDLNKLGHTLLEMKPTPNDPNFCDQNYRSRRVWIGQQALHHRIG